jgi:hypothetical protein
MEASVVSPARIGSLWATVRGWLAEARGYQRLAYVVGAGLILIGLAHAAIAAVSYEVAWVVVQHARGVPAHFNDTTPPRRAAVHRRGGDGRRRHRGDRRHDPGRLRPRRPAAPVDEHRWAAGSMKFAHAVPMHAIQVLAAPAWLLSRSGLSQHRQIQLVALAVVGYGGLFAVALGRTSFGLAPQRPGQAAGRGELRQGVYDPGQRAAPAASLPGQCQRQALHHQGEQRRRSPQRGR